MIEGENAHKQEFLLNKLPEDRSRRLHNVFDIGRVRSKQNPLQTVMARYTPFSSIQ
jgi:hypothetical protein